LADLETAYYISPTPAFPARPKKNSTPRIPATHHPQVPRGREGVPVGRYGAEGCGAGVSTRWSCQCRCRAVLEIPYCAAMSRNEYPATSAPSIAARCVCLQMVQGRPTFFGPPVSRHFLSSIVLGQVRQRKLADCDFGECSPAGEQ